MGTSKYIWVALYRNNWIPKPEEPEVCYYVLTPKTPYSKARIYSFSVIDFDMID